MNHMVIVVVAFKAAAGALESQRWVQRGCLLRNLPAYERLEAVRHGTRPSLFLDYSDARSTEDLFTIFLFAHDWLYWYSFTNAALDVFVDICGARLHSDRREFFRVHVVCNSLIDNLKRLGLNLQVYFLSFNHMLIFSIQL